MLSPADERRATVVLGLPEQTLMISVCGFTHAVARGLAEQPASIDERARAGASRRTEMRYACCSHAALSCLVFATVACGPVVIGVGANSLGGDKAAPPPMPRMEFDTESVRGEVDPEEIELRFTALVDDTSVGPATVTLVRLVDRSPVTLNMGTSGTAILLRSASGRLNLACEYKLSLGPIRSSEGATLSNQDTYDVRVREGEWEALGSPLDTGDGSAIGDGCALHVFDHADGRPTQGIVVWAYGVNSGANPTSATFGFSTRFSGIDGPQSQERCGSFSGNAV